MQIFAAGERASGGVETDRETNVPIRVRRARIGCWRISGRPVPSTWQDQTAANGADFVHRFVEAGFDRGNFVLALLVRRGRPSQDLAVEPQRCISKELGRTIMQVRANPAKVTLIKRRHALRGPVHAVPQGPVLRQRQRRFFQLLFQRMTLALDRPATAKSNRRQQDEEYEREGSDGEPGMQPRAGHAPLEFARTFMELGNGHDLARPSRVRRQGGDYFRIFAGNSLRTVVPDCSTRLSHRNIR